MFATNIFPYIYSAVYVELRINIFCRILFYFLFFANIYSKEDYLNPLDINLNLLSFIFFFQFLFNVLFLVVFVPVYDDTTYTKKKRKMCYIIHGPKENENTLTVTWLGVIYFQTKSKCVCVHNLFCINLNLNQYYTQHIIIYIVYFWSPLKMYTYMNIYIYALNPRNVTYICVWHKYTTSSSVKKKHLPREDLI